MAPKLGCAGISDSALTLQCCLSSKARGQNREGVGTAETTCAHLASLRVRRKETVMPNVVFSPCAGKKVHLMMCGQKVVVLKEPSKEVVRNLEQNVLF